MSAQVPAWAWEDIDGRTCGFQLNLGGQPGVNNFALTRTVGRGRSTILDMKVTSLIKLSVATGRNTTKYKQQFQTNFECSVFYSPFHC